MIYWTKKKSDVSVRYRAYKIHAWSNTFPNPNYTRLDPDVLAEIYVFLHKENHGSCVGMIKDKSLTHFKSKEEAFEIISEQIK